MHPFKTRLLSLILVVALPAIALAQNSPKISFQNPFGSYNSNPQTISTYSGVMGYWGDLDDYDFKVGLMRPTVGFSWNYYLGSNLSFRGSFTGGTIFSDDQVSKYETHRARNLHFRSRIYEVSTMLEFQLFKNPNLSKTYFYKMGTFFTPYFFAGVGLFNFNPQAEYNGQWVDLQPLGTEGQLIGSNIPGSEYEGVGNYPEPYKLTQLSIPYGAGVSVFVSKLWTLSLEGNFRKTFTDYLDDVSTTYPDPALLLQTPGGQTAVDLSDRVDTSIRTDVKGIGAPRGNPGGKDFYYTFTIRASYFLNWKNTSK